jgi:hypothetical protein
MSRVSKFINISLMLCLFCTCTSAPKKVVKVPTWQEVVGTQTIKKLDRITLSFEIWSTKDLVKNAELESSLAATGLIADLEGSRAKRSIVVGDTECEIHTKKVSNTVRNERIGQCRDALTGDETTQINQATHQIQISCQARGLAGALESHNVSVGLLKKNPGLWIDINQSRCGQATKYNRFLSEKFIGIQSEIKQGSLSVWTRGLAGFGFKEVALTPLDTDRRQLAKDRLLSLADQILRIEGQGIGQEVQSGLSVAIYAPAKSINTLQSVQSSWNHTLVLVNPKAKSNNKSAHKKFNFRFTQP